jgi:4-hydroxy-tetrahydrodipicolinate reductase
VIDVVSYGLGPIGCDIARHVIELPGIRLVGAVDLRSDLAGLDVGSLLLTEPVGVVITPDIRHAGPSSGDGVVIHATSSRLAQIFDQLQLIVRQGWNVLSTCEELTYPAIADSSLSDALDRAARTAGVSVLASGINPGFVMDTLPLFLSAACLQVDSIRVRRVVDTNKRRERLQEKAGVGLTVEEFQSRAAQGSLGHVGLRQSARIVAAGRTWDITTYEETLEPVVASEDTATPLGVVTSGFAIGQRQVGIARSNDAERIRLELEMSAGAEPTDLISITGTPSIQHVVEGGMHGDKGTVAIICGLIAAVRSARPGLLTMLDLIPFLSSRSGPGREENEQLSL